MEQNVGGVEIPMADTLAVHVLHASRNCLDAEHSGAPVAAHRGLGEGTRVEERSQGAAIAVLLHAPVQMWIL